MSTTGPQLVYGVFLAYVDVLNKGIRKTELESWWLHFQTKEKEKQRLKPFNMSEPKVTIGGLEKFYPVLGQRGLHFGGSTLTEPGCSIIGMVFFEYECFGDESWNPSILDGKVSTAFFVKSIFGKTCQCTIEFSEKPLNKIDAVAPGIHLISRK